MKKKLLILLSIPIVLIALVLLVVFLSLNGIVRRSIEANATQSLKVPSTVGGAIVSPFGGSVALTDFAIGSPKGFTAPQMFALQGVSVGASMGQLFGSPIHVKSIHIEKPHLVLEQAGGKLNVMVLKQNLTDPTTPPPPTGDKPLKPTLLIIDQLDLGEATVSLLPGVPGVKPYEITLPDVSLTNLGNADGKQSGAEIGQIVTDIASALAAKAADSDQVPPQIRELLHLDVGQLTQQLTEHAKQELQKQSSKLGVDLGGLLGEKKEKKKPTP